MHSDNEEVPLTWDLYQMLPQYLITFQTCFHCGASFRECENIGLHACRIHPGIRMYTNAGPQRSFYSCCGRLAGAHGCTEADHNASALDVSDVRRRVAELRDFSTIVMPRLLLRFITPPLQSSVLYRGIGGGSSSFRHRFRVLARTLETTRESSVTHTFQLPVYDNAAAVDNAGLFTDDDSLVTRVYALKDEARALLEQSNESPLFMRLSALSSDKNQKARIDCENAWRSRIGRNGGEEEASNNCVSFRGAPSIPFVIISRIHDT